MSVTVLAQSKVEGRPSSTGRFLRISDVIATTGLSRPTIYRLVAQGDFPAQFALTKRCVGWWDTDVAEWLCKRLGSRSP